MHGAGPDNVLVMVFWLYPAVLLRMIEETTAQDCLSRSNRPVIDQSAIVRSDPVEDTASRIVCCGAVPVPFELLETD